METESHVVMREGASDPAIQEDLERFTQDAVYVDEHRMELLAKYPERWIAVYKKELIAVAKDIEGLRKKVLSKGLHPGYVYREYLTDEEVELLLPAMLR